MVSTARTLLASLAAAQELAESYRLAKQQQLAGPSSGGRARAAAAHSPAAAARRAVTPEQASWVFVGGVPEAAWRAAPPLPQVQAQVAALIQGRVLVGHNLPQDLATLGISHPRELQRDTMRYRQLQSGRRRGQRLAALSEQKLGRRIQEAGRRHDPREDALAALDLYVQHVHLDPSSMGYEDLVEHHLAQILKSSGRADGNSSGRSSMYL
ncbi:hypothetical protein N2152v2_003969 [Parachlorella kessleri]